uniref:Si:ch1073-416j23.1 n=1 Tax=Cyprinodon variegatus TaxID=28743 RepID=A0A3Q2G233_CYPVA
MGDSRQMLGGSYASMVFPAPNVPAEFLDVVKNFEAVRKRWLHAELELKKYKELLVKSDVAKASLEIKLKHARNQLDVEMQKRHKIEADYHRLSVIDESSFLSHSDISYDCTDDDVVRSTPLYWQDSPSKIMKTSFRLNHICFLIVMESSFCPTEPLLISSDQTSFWSSNNDMLVELEAPLEERDFPTVEPQNTLRHVFVSKTVIRPETCAPCGKRIRFGKMAVKCRNCQLVAHSECKQKFPNGCSSPSARIGSGAQMVPLACLTVKTPLVRCLYRVPGGERPLRDLREQIRRGKPSLMLHKVHDIHVVCGLLKDFLRRLKEPLITFRLHQTFMEASGKMDEDNGSAVLYRAISELPKVNRDTLAFIMIHLHKVMRSPHCQMDKKNIGRVFGPAIVGHSMPEPSPSTILRDSAVQPKVCFAISLGFEPVPSGYVHTAHDLSRFFQPLTSPEINNLNKITSPGSLRGRIKHMGNASSSK